MNYLRNGKLLLPNDSMIRKELLEEAMFYQIQGIIIQLEEKMFQTSLILKDEKHCSALMSWLPPNASCSLLYQTSANGTTPDDFHRCCDNKGPTLVVVKSDQYIFGGYTSQSWELAAEGNFSVSLLKYTVKTSYNCSKLKTCDVDLVSYLRLQTPPHVSFLKGATRGFFFQVCHLQSVLILNHPRPRGVRTPHFK